ncbi:MAG: phosphotransferase [Chlorobiaceae bacterium]
MTDRETISALFPLDQQESLTVTKIQGDASTRQYFRVRTDEGSFVVCRDPAFDSGSGDDYPFLKMQRILFRHGIAVPCIISTAPEKGLLLLEDCGEVLLQNLFDSPLESAIPDIYGEIIDTLVRLQAIKGEQGEIPFSLSFDREKLMMEFDFFIEHALGNYYAGMIDSEKIASLRSEFEGISEILAEPRHFVLNHRDFHSRNILIHQERPVIIDFQDARMGLPQYDAVSLIRDSYVRLGEELSEELKSRHYQALRSHGLSAMSFDEYLHYFDIMAFQRNIKAIGTFAFQTTVRKSTAFEHSILPTLRYLPDYISARGELKKAGSLLQPILEGVSTAP